MTNNTDAIHKILTSYWNELATYEQAAYKLVTESMAYANQLAAEWRKLGLEATKKLTEQFAKA